MIRALAIAALFVCGCEKKGADVTARDAIAAINTANFDKLNERLVLAGKVGDLVECQTAESEWLTGGHRQSWHRDLRHKLNREFWRGGSRAELVSIAPVDEGDWYVYDAGEKVAPGCAAKQPFGVQSYQMTISITNKLGDRRESSFGVTMWTYDKNWFLWSSPLGH